jgi:hypothetical protein
MRHLSPETLVDLLDGTHVESDVPHLASCDACAAQLAELRRTWQLASAVEAPEPSPLFWEHLSARVREQVAAEQPLKSGPVGWLHGLGSFWKGAGLAGAAVAAIAVLAIWTPRTGESPVPAVNSVAAVNGDRGPAVPAPAIGTEADPAADDEPLGFVADLAGSLDWDMPDDLGITLRGGADRAVGDLSDEERTELRRLLTDAMAGA